MLLLVRHARAGSSEDWDGDDRLRPLDERGVMQARALVEVLAPYAPARIVSSPARRCLDTVAPLAARLGLSVEARVELDEERQGLDGAALVAELADGETVVVCGHGGLEAAVLAEPPRWRKGSTFVLDGRLSLVDALPVPA